MTTVSDIVGDAATQPMPTTSQGVIRPCLDDQQDKITNPVVEEAPSDISRSRVDGPVQPQLKDFPRTPFGDRRRNFSAS
ncbi:unnamed protein product, partial [Boreogadus saida]